MRFIQQLFWVCIISGLITSCKSDKPEVIPADKINTQPLTGVYILDEGNFGWGNASIDFYNFKEGKVYFNVFEATNNRSLGDVFQSMTIYKNKGYLIVNNSGKIEVVNPATLESIGTITGLISPRYFVGLNDTIAYVSDFKSNKIAVVNLMSLSIQKIISCPGWTEEMLIVGSKLFVTNIRKEYVYLIDTKSDIVEDSIKVGDGPNSIRLDKNGKVWVLCGGDNNKKPALVKIDPNTKKVELSLSFNTSDSPWKLKINGEGDKLYYLNNGVYELLISNTSLSTKPIILQNSMVFYGLGVDPLSGEIYVSDAIDYTQQGRVYRHRVDGSLISSFDVGVIPGDFCFY